MEEIAGIANLIEMVNKKVMVSLKDDRTLFGYLRSVDELGNLVLHESIERVYHGNKYGDIEIGVLLIMESDIVLLGEVDPEKEQNLSLKQAPAKELLEAKRIEKEKKAQKYKLMAKVKARGFTS